LGRKVSRLNFLLFPEVCLVCGLAGILAWRETGPGLFLLFCVLFLDRPRSAKAARAFCLLLVFALSFGCAALRENGPPPLPDWLRESSTMQEDERGELRPPKATRIRARVEATQPLPDERLRLILSAARPAPGLDKNGENLAPYRGRLVWNWNAPEFSPLPGQILEASLRLLPLHDSVNPGVWDTERRNQDQNIWFRVRGGGKNAAAVLGQENDGEEKIWPTGLARLREKARVLFCAALPAGETKGGKSGAAGILPALIFGDRSYLSQFHTDLFAKSTLAHSLSLSGVHLGFALLAGAACARILTFFFADLQKRLPRQKLALLLSLPFALLYLWVGQAPPPLLRATYMLFFSTLLVFLNRPRVLLDALCIALLFILLADPFALFDISLQLSALCMACIALILPGLNTSAERFFPFTPASAQTAPPPPKSAFFSVPGKHLPSRIRVKRATFTILALSLGVQVLLFPFTLRIFGFSGLLFPLNLIWLPVLEMFVLPLAFFGLITLCLNLPLLGAGALQLAALPCEALIALLTKLEAANLLAAPLLPRPHWLCIAAFWLLCLTLPALVRACFPGIARIAGQKGIGSEAPRRDRTPGQGRGESKTALSSAAAWPAMALLLMLAPWVWTCYADSKTFLSLSLIDVGNGQSVLLSWKGQGGAEHQGRVLIDGGSAVPGLFSAGRFIVAPALTDMTRPRLWAAINSHPDSDHLGGLLYILENFSLEHYFSNGQRPAPALERAEQAVLRRSSLKRETLGAGEDLELAPGLRLEVLWPPPASGKLPLPAKTATSNNLSLVLRLLWEDKPLALICGDAETAALQSLLQKGADLRAQVLILPHHGSKNGMAPGFYESVRPDLALASCGFANPWGFPSRAVREALSALNIPLRSTAQYGQIRLTWKDPDSRPELRLTRAD
jgi:competence protein ComEC